MNFHHTVAARLLGRKRSQARWVAAAWFCLWAPVYTVYWGWKNFLSLCDVAMAVSCVGFWRGSSLLISSQTLPSLLVGGLWSVDVGARVLTGRHAIGGTEYMWDRQVPLLVRLISLFHIGLPVAQLASLRRLGYDRRALILQSAITGPVLVAARLLTEPDRNINYAHRDPFGRSWGSAPTHLTAIWAGSITFVYLPTHLLLGWLFPRRRGLRDRVFRRRRSRRRSW